MEEEDNFTKHRRLPSVLLQIKQLDIEKSVIVEGNCYIVFKSILKEARLKRAMGKN